MEADSDEDKKKNNVGIALKCILNGLFNEMFDITNNKYKYKPWLYERNSGSSHCHLN